MEGIDQAQRGITLSEEGGERKLQVGNATLKTVNCLEGFFRKWFGGTAFTQRVSVGTKEQTVYFLTKEARTLLGRMPREGNKGLGREFAAFVRSSLHSAQPSSSEVQSFFSIFSLDSPNTTVSITKSVIDRLSQFGLSSTMLPRNGEIPKKNFLRLIAHSNTFPLQLTIPDDISPDEARFLQEYRKTVAEVEKKETELPSVSLGFREEIPVLGEYQLESQDAEALLVSGSFLPSTDFSDAEALLVSGSFLPSTDFSDAVLRSTFGRERSLPLSYQRKIASEIADPPVLVNRERKILAMIQWLRKGMRFDIGILNDESKAGQLETHKARFMSLTDYEDRDIGDSRAIARECIGDLLLMESESMTWMSVEAISPDHQTIALRLRGEEPRKVLISMSDFFELIPTEIRFQPQSPINQDNF